MKKIIIIVSFFICSVANAEYKDELITKASHMELWKQPQWTKLIHYKNGESIVASDRFFLSEEGKTNSQKELIATISSFFEDPIIETKETVEIKKGVTQEIVNSHSSCTFRARYNWLNDNLDFEENLMPKATCEKYNEYKENTKAQNVTLVFAAAYLNQPSSMFGHTFLKLDTTKGEDVDMLSKIINFGALHPVDPNGFAYAYNGITGGYPGVFNIIPYYEKIKSYGAIDNRDLWEYQLNLTQAEVDLIIDHVWELGYQYIDYYFFDYNCSYLMLELLETARPSLDLTSDYTVHAIPVDTIQSVLKEAELLREISYRPSLKTTIDSRYNKMSQKEKDVVKQLISNDIDPKMLLGLNDAGKAKTIEVAYDLQQYNMVKSGLQLDKMRKNSMKLLKERYKLKGVKTEFQIASTPRYKPHEGHKPATIRYGLGSYNDNTFSEFTIRPSYHSLDDNSIAKNFGSQIELLETSLRYYHDEDALNINEFKFASILSLSPRNDIFKPLSWKLGLKATPTYLTDLTNHNIMGSGYGGVGHTYEIYNNTLVYGMGEAEINFASSKLPHSRLIGVGGSLGIASDLENYKVIMNTKYMKFPNNEEYDFWENNINLSHHLSIDDSIYLKYKNRNYKERSDDHEISIGFNHNFNLF